MYPECDCITIAGSCAVLIRETKVHKFCISEHENIHVHVSCIPS